MRQWRGGRGGRAEGHKQLLTRPGTGIVRAQRRSRHDIRIDRSLRTAKGEVMFDDLPQFVFLTGKGGVGKTSLACATA
ncbi:MAG: ArsA-related P-loop ATPase, partial [Gemmobacter sp.]